MPFTPPKFVNNMDLWPMPTTPATSLPAYTNQPCQIYTWSKSANFWFDSTTGKWVPVIIIRFPDSTAVNIVPGWIIGKDLAAPNDDVMFVSLFRERMHTGFPNVYKQHYCVQCTRTGAVVVQPRP